MPPRPVLIAGATASGKSALALRLAERDGGCVINADAAQVYACWRVLTARPGPDDLTRAPHALYGHVSCATRYSVGAWLRDATAAIDAARARGLRPIVVGGTGLYLGSLTDGLADIPAIPPEIRRRSEAMLRDDELDRLLAALARDDPATLERIDRNNPMRVQRAWEVLIATGRGLSDWQRNGRPPVLAAGDCVRLVVEQDLVTLNSHIESRFETMLNDGALAECTTFIRDGYDPQSPAGRVLGAAPLIAHLRGQTTLEAATTASLTATRQFAKRQRTWLRNRMPDWTRIAPGALGDIPGR